MHAVLRFPIVLLVFSIFAHGAFGDAIVRFDKPEYVVRQAGDAIDLQVLIDSDDQTEAPEGVLEGLFSFGVSVGFDVGNASVTDVNSVGVVGALNHFGVSDGAFIQVNTQSASAKGNIDQAASPLVSYDGTELATISLNNLLAAPATYQLTLSEFRTLGDTEQIFIDGTGTVLDDSITFGTAIVRVVPEPVLGTTTLVTIGLLCIVCRHNRSTRP